MVKEETPSLEIKASLNPNLLKDGFFKNLGEILWTYTDPDAIPYNVSINGEGSRIWVGQGLNYARAQFFDSQTSLPLWEFAFVIGEWESEVLVSQSLEGSLLAALGHDQGKLYVFDPAALPPCFPVLKYDLGGEYLGRALAISRDGSTLVVGANDSKSKLKIFVFDSSTPPPETLWTKEMVGQQWDCVEGVDLTDDGSLILITTYYDFYVLKREDGSLIKKGENYGEVPAQISGDGSYLVSGDFEGRITVYHWNEENQDYDTLWTYDAGDCWVTALDISDDGSTIMAGTFDYTNLPNSKVLIFNIISNVPLWEYKNYGDLVSDVSLTLNGFRGVAVSWGDRENLLYDLTIFNRESSSPLFSLSSPGSFFSAEISGDGNYVIAGSKLVHARTLGRGGTLYFISLNLPGIEHWKEREIQKANLVIYPNPFRSFSNIVYFSPCPRKSARHSFKIFNLSGQLIRTLWEGEVSSGSYRASWEGRDEFGNRVADGIYFGVWEGGTERVVRKLILLN